MTQFSDIHLHILIFILQCIIFATISWSTNTIVHHDSRVYT